MRKKSHNTAQSALPDLTISVADSTFDSYPARFRGLAVVAVRSAWSICTKTITCPLCIVLYNTDLEEALQQSAEFLFLLLFGRATMNEALS